MGPEQGLVEEKGRLAELEARIAALEAENARLRGRPGGASDAETILSSISDGVLVFDRDWRFVYLNAAAERLLGSGRDELLGRVQWEVYPATLGTPVEGHYRQVMETRRPAAFENHYAPWDRWFELRIDPVADGGIIVYFRDVTERKRTEERLQASEALARARLDELEAIYASAPVGLCILDRDLRYLRINERLAETNGIPAEAHLGRTIRELLPGIADEAEAIARPILETGLPAIDIELTGETPARPGEIRTWVESWLPIRDRDGGITGISVVAQEVTEARRVQAELRETAERLTVAMDAGRLGDWSWDAASGATRLSPRALALFGVDAEVGQSWDRLRDFLAPEDRAAAAESFARALAGADDYAAEFRIIRPDGTQVTVASQGRVQRDASGALTGMVGVLRDVTEERAAAAALRASEAKLAGVLESVSDGFYALDSDWRFTVFNAAAERYFGKSREEVLGRRVWDVYPDARGTIFEERYTPVMEGRRSITFETRSVARPDRMVEMRAAPLRGGGIAVAFTDITERKQAEAALRESRERLDLAVDAHGIGIFDWHVQTGRVIWSAEEERLFGLEPGTFGGDIDHWAGFVLPEDLPRMQAHMTAAMEARRERLDFAFRIRRPDGAVRHIEGAARFLYAEDGTPLRMVGTNADVTERALAEEHRRLLVDELNHRVKNTLAIVQGLAQQTFRDPATRCERDAFEGRLAALATAHNVLTRENWHSADLGEIVRDALTAHGAAPHRLLLRGPPVRLEPKTAVTLAMALHELGTNATKYGALSVPGGRVSVAWSVAPDQERGRTRLSLLWTETGGPIVAPPARRGFGSRMIERALAAELDGAVRLDFRPEGVVCGIEARLREAGAPVGTE
ncbi:MAG TPA: PAS domain-containing protein [Azospirillaceae bacterium]|nr:PAS domain-containing protein [Azospirillaceae bacterium]